MNLNKKRYPISTYPFSSKCYSLFSLFPSSGPRHFYPIVYIVLTLNLNDFWLQHSEMYLLGINARQFACLPRCGNNQNSMYISPYFSHFYAKKNFFCSFLLLLCSCVGFFFFFFFFFFDTCIKHQKRGENVKKKLLKFYQLIFHFNCLLCIFISGSIEKHCSNPITLTPISSFFTTVFSLASIKA